MNADVHKRLLVQMTQLECELSVMDSSYTLLNGGKIELLNPCMRRSQLGEVPL